MTGKNKYWYQVDKSSMLESLTSKTLTNWVTFLFALLKINVIVELSHGCKGLRNVTVHGFHVYKAEGANYCWS